MIILGNGRVGGSLYRRAQNRNIEVQLLDRTTSRAHLSQYTDTPILVCTNADDIAGVVATIPPDSLQSLVFVQNGMIDPVLDELGCGRATRGLLYFAVPTRGSAIEPGGVSVFTGPLAQRVVDWFGAVELDANVVSSATFSAEMASKLIWNCTFGLLCDVHQRSVGVLVEHHRDEVDRLVTELCMVASAALGCPLDPVKISDDLCAYSLSIHGYRGALKQWKWRNGWFVEVATRLQMATPTHSHLLQRSGAL